MNPPKDHPFTVHLKPCLGAPGSYAWVISRRRVPCLRSGRAYASFDEARLAAQAALRGVLEAWRASAPVAIPAGAV